MTVTLEVFICEARRSYLASFCEENHAIAFIARKGNGYIFREAENSMIPEDWETLARVLYPLCEHNMSADLCYGPAHYASDEEIARGW